MPASPFDAPLPFDAAAPFDGGFAPPSTGIDIEMGPELVLHTISLAERQTAAGTDGSGAPVESWSVLLNGLPFPCTVWLRPKGAETFGQAALEYHGKVYIPPLTLPISATAWVQNNLYGSLPDIRVRDRMTFGTWPQNGKPRILIVAPAPEGQMTLNPVENNTMLVLWVTARAPG